MRAKVPARALERLRENHNHQSNDSVGRSRALRLPARRRLEEDMNTAKANSKTMAVSTGADRLDGILDGGYASNRVHLIEGRPSLFVTFDETKAILGKRAAGMGWQLEQPISPGQLILEQVDPAELSPGELTGTIRRHVEGDNVRIVVLDSPESACCARH